MPDRPVSPAPRDWHEALSALPLEAPPRSAWPTIAARMAAPPQSRWPLLLAIAAAVALVAVVPLQRIDQASADDATGTASAVASAGATRPAGARTDQGAAVPTRPSAGALAAVAGASGPRPADGPDGPAVVVPNTGGRVAATPPEPTASADAATAVPRLAVDATAAAVRRDASRATLERLYAESAQLEAVLAMARDERMASGPAAALADGLDSQLSGIDAALAQPGLSLQRREALWQQRVQALRQLAGFETTQRWLAASGDRYDNALVGID